ncbi:MAG TPA: hypothetical protein GX513_07450, partial [Firmicutes bacterium]|nr:hypothetical protein [Bacillota bacterium]
MRSKKAVAGLVLACAVLSSVSGSWLTARAATDLPLEERGFRALLTAAALIRENYRG